MNSYRKREGFFFFLLEIVDLRNFLNLNQQVTHTLKGENDKGEISS